MVIRDAADDEFDTAEQSSVFNVLCDEEVVSITALSAMADNLWMTCTSAHCGCDRTCALSGRYPEDSAAIEACPASWDESFPSPEQTLVRTSATL